MATEETSPKAAASTQRLITYWTTGPGGARIAWGTDGSFDRCVLQLQKYLPPGQVKGFCARLHKRATGEWPAEKGVRS